MDQDFPTAPIVSKPLFFYLLGLLGFPFFGFGCSLKGQVGESLSGNRQNKTIAFYKIRRQLCIEAWIKKLFPKFMFFGFIACQKGLTSLRMRLLFSLLSFGVVLKFGGIKLWIHNIGYSPVTLAYLWSTSGSTARVPPAYLWRTSGVPPETTRLLQATIFARKYANAHARYAFTDLQIFQNRKFEPPGLQPAIKNRKPPKPKKPKKPKFSRLWPFPTAPIVSETLVFLVS